MDSASANLELEDSSYVDAKGRLRWQFNDRIADLLKQLYDFLIIGNYEESHAARYPRLAHFISRWDQSVLKLYRTGRLQEIPGVSEKIAQIISELVATGTCRKMDDGDEFFTPPPKSVLELTRIPRLGAKTARLLYQEHGIMSLESLKAAAEAGSLAEIRGVGKKMIEAILVFENSEND